MKTGVELIAEERQRQIDVECWTKEHDSEHENFELSAAACCYASHNISQQLEKIHHTNQSPLAEFKIYDFGESDFFINNGDRGDRRLRKAGWKNGFPWDYKWWKPSKDPIKNLVKAGALIAAEIDRLQNSETSQRGQKTTCTNAE
jgi:hypothetical protein